MIIILLCRKSKSFENSRDFFIIMKYLIIHMSLMLNYVKICLHIQQKIKQQNKNINKTFGRKYE